MRSNVALNEEVGGGGVTQGTRSFTGGVAQRKHAESIRFARRQ